MKRKRLIFGLLIILLIAGGMVMLEERTGLLSVGDTAPQFVARLSGGEVVSLGNFRRKKHVVLFFYPKDFTRGCTKQVCSYRDNYSHIAGMGAVMFGVSYDPERSHSQFVEKYNLPFPLISDTTAEIASAYGATRPGGRLLPPKRVTYVIDKEGIVRGVFHHEILIEKHVEGVLATLEGLR